MLPLIFAQTHSKCSIHYKKKCQSSHSILQICDCNKKPIIEFQTKSGDALPDIFLINTFITQYREYQEIFSSINRCPNLGNEDEQRTKDDI